MQTVKKQKPFIKKFKQGENYYVYDVNTNRIVQVDKIEYAVCGDFEENRLDMVLEKFKNRYPEKDIKKAFTAISSAKKESGLFSNYRPEMVTFGIGSVPGVKDLIDGNLTQVILEVTTNCNLGCKYCSAAGKYAEHKSGKPQNMPVETALKAVKFLLDNSENSETRYIGFYGGEPLLRFDLVKAVVDFVNKKGIKNHRFSMTTNGALLNKEIVDFFIQHDFSLLFSLDGPRGVHDRYRVFKNGRGTFDRVIASLQYIRKYNSDYFSKKVSVNCVLSPPFEINRITRFFSNHSLFTGPVKIGNVKPNFVFYRDTSFIKDFKLEESEKKTPAAHNKLLNRLKKALIAGNFDTLSIEKDLYFSALYNIAKSRKREKLNRFMRHFGPCVLGQRRFYVDTAGEFFICERGSANDYRIGDIEKGFDYEKMLDYYRKFDELFADCKDCWALLHCEKCFASIGDIENFSGKEKEHFCKTGKFLIEKYFKTYCEILNRNPDAFKPLKDAVKK